jgi:hypothetical protein
MGGKGRNDARSGENVAAVHTQDAAGTENRCPDLCLGIKELLDREP